MTEGTTEGATERARLRGRFGSFESVVFPLVLAWAAFLAFLPFNDNSAFTHLATGRIILSDGRVPSTDPYTYTAYGESWTVQSWLASIAYAAAERLGGVLGLRLLVLLVFLVSGWVLWRLTQPASSVLVRVGVVGAAMSVASSVWSERPYMIGFIGVGLVLLALDGAVRPWLLVPFAWLWVNTHGSYALAVVLCLAVLLGEWLDQRRRPQATGLRVEMRTFVALLTGVLLGAVSPLGLQALLFPLRLLTQSESFAEIVEWKAPEFTSISERMFLVLVLTAVAAVVAQRRWRYVVPLLVFVAAALLARRNIVVALPIVVLTIARAAPQLGSLRNGTVPPGGRVLAALMWATLPMAVGVGLDLPSLGLGGYPASALSFVESRPSEGALVAQDFAGNLIEVLDGPTRSVFVDDRADMFPTSVLRDYRTLNNGEPGWSAVLARYGASTVVWERSHPLASLLVADPDWRVEYTDSEWIVARRR